MTRRILTAGAAAGLILILGETILNRLVLGPDWDDILFELGLTGLSLGGGLAFLVATFLLGMFVAFLYSNLTRGRFRRFLTATLFLWFTVFLYPIVWLGGLGLFPVRVLVVSAIWGLGETLLAAIVVAWICERVED
jgi:hypothetical protein